MNFFISCIKGIALGAGAILPGISSGVLCVIFGIYERLVNSILEFFNDWKKNLLFLFPILLGVGIGVVLFGNLLKVVFTSYPISTKFAFIGLILGSIPTLLKTANHGRGFRIHYLIYTLTTFLLAIFLLSLEHVNFSSGSSNTSFLFLVLSGFIMSVGVVVPGVSSSVLLMLLGVYDVYLNAVSSLQISILFPMGIGLVLGGFLFLLLTRFCLTKYSTQTYYSIIGFVLGSLLILFPEFHSFTELLGGLLVFILSFSLTYCLETIKK